MAGDVIPGLGGVRKLRFFPRRQKSVLRVIYYVLDETVPVLALLLYGKNEQAELSPAQRKAVADLAQQMRQERQRR